MATRTIRIGQHPDYRDEIRGSLSEILASTVNPGTYAAPEDVTGTSLEMGSDGLWTGASVGCLTQAQADALVSSGAMGKVKAGTPAVIAGNRVRWTGTAWQSDLIVGPFTDLPAANAWAAANPSSLFPGLLATAGGATVMWGGSAWMHIGAPYVGANIPTTAPYIGHQIIADTASTGVTQVLRWNGKKYTNPLVRQGVIALGSSSTESSATGGWFEYVCYATQGRMLRLANLAKGGYRIDQMWADCDTAISMNPEEIWIQAGGNKPIGPVTVPALVAQALLDMQVIIDKCKAAQIPLRIFGAQPAGATPDYYHHLNAGLQALCVSNGIKYTFLWDFVMDSSGMPINSYYVEAAGSEVHMKKTTHLTGAMNLAAEFPSTAFGVAVPAYSTAPAFGKISDPLMLTGTALVASGWDNNTDGTYYVASRTTANTRGYKQMLTLASASSLDKIIEKKLTALTPGKTYDFIFRVDIVSTGILNCKVQVLWQKSDYSQSKGDVLLYHSPTFTGVVWARLTMPIWATGATSLLQFQIIGSEANGSLGSISWETIQIIDVAAAGG